MDHVFCVMLVCYYSSFTLKLRDIETDTMVEVTMPSTDLIRYKQFVEKSPEVEALLRHIATIDDPEQRLRMLVQFRSRFIRVCQYTV